MTLHLSRSLSLSLSLFMLSFQAMNPTFEFRGFGRTRVDERLMRQGRGVYYCTLIVRWLFQVHPALPVPGLTLLWG